METLHYLLMKTHTMLQRRITAGAAELGLSSGQPKVLDYLSRHEGSDQKTLAAYCEIEQATAGSLLNRMEAAGLIERRQKAGNRRSLYVYLTAQGKQAAEAMSRVFVNADWRAAEALSEAELEQLKAFLSKICLSLEKQGEE